MGKSRRNSEMWKYLEQSGVLEHGSDEQIKAAKKSYRKKYMLAFKRQQRAAKPEYTVNFETHSGEHGRVKLAADKHNVSVSAFIRLAVLAYMEQRYIVPNARQIARLEQMLAECLNEIRTIVNAKEKWYWQREQKMEEIEKRIEKLEKQIDEVFRHPLLIADHDRQNKIA